MLCEATAADGLVFLSFSWLGVFFLLGFFSFSLCFAKVRQRDHDSFHQASDDCRPLSEASSFGGDDLVGEVRLRDKPRVSIS